MISEPDPVKLLAAILWKDADTLGETLRRLRRAWGPVDFEGQDHPFDVTEYYRSEMGDGLQRRLISFERLMPPDCIVKRKLEAIEIEDCLRGPTGRRINLDVGYLDVHKLVLASVKSGAQKIYVGRGVYADTACRYSRGHYHSFEWSFPDLRDGRYDAELVAICVLYKAGLRAG